MSTGALKRLSWNEYLARERDSEIKHEFFDGEVFAMAGARRPHNVISLNVASELRAALKDRSCEVYNSDMRVRCPDGLGTYPDVAVACDPLFEDETEDTLLNPAVIIEVLSPSTERWDRGRKFESYRGISSLREYVLVSQSHCLIEHFARDAAFDQWLLATESSIESSIAFPTLGISVPLAQVYDRIAFDPSEERHNAPEGGPR